MQYRYLLLKSWVDHVFEEDKSMTAKKLVKEFEKDTTLAMADILKYELKTLKEVKNAN